MSSACVLCSETFKGGVKTGYKDNILVYMAGYIQRRIVSKETCDECLNIVKGCQTTSQFLNLRERGGLVRPNEDILKVVTLTDNVIVIRDRLAKLLTDRDVFKKINVEVLTTAIYMRYIILGSCAFYSAPVILIIAPVIDPILLSQVYYQVGESPNLRF